MGGRTATFLGLMSGLTNYTMADELRVKQALDIAVATGDLLAVDKNGKTRRRKGTSIKSTDILIAPRKDASSSCHL